MLSYPNAKINIGLNITEKRNDGFHNIVSVFYPIQWCDALEIIPSSSANKFNSTGIPIPGSSESNLCMKAHQLLQEHYDISNVHIHLHKLIPIGAGLGGGSADAAYTLKMLNELFSLNLGRDELLSFAKKLGSDCAFFIDNKPTLATEKGDVFQETTLDLSSYEILVVNPQIHIGTAEAYAGVTPRQIALDLFKQQLSEDPKKWKGHLSNDFEKSIFPNHADISNLKDQLYTMGAIYSSMTGSGSSVYGIFKKRPKTTPIPDNYVYKWV